MGEIVSYTKDGIDALIAGAGSGGITQEDLDAAIAALVDSAPGTLDTLNELAAALADDANFASTMTTALGDLDTRVDALEAGGGGSGQLQEFFTTGVLTVSAGTGRFAPPFPITILGVSLVNDTAPTGSAIIVDVNKNGTTIFTNQGNRPQVPIGGYGTVAEVTNMDITAVAAGEYITVDIDQIGSATPGSNLGVILRYEEA